MATATTYPTEDAAFVRGLFLDWTPDPLPSAGWAGIVESGKALVPNPAPSGIPKAPTVYAAWGLTYGKKIGDYEGEAAPIRYGSLIVTRFREDDGNGNGPSRLLATAILELLLAASADGPLCFDVQGFREADMGPRGAFQLENLIVPFVGD